MPKQTYEHILTKDYLLENYVKLNKRTRDIAKEVGCKGKTVHSFLRRFKIELKEEDNNNGRKISNGRYGKSYSHILTKEFLEEQYVNLRKGPYIIAREVGCNQHTVYDYIDFYKIPRIDNTKQIKVGDKFDYLTAEKILSTNKYGHKWLCRCECGKEVILLTTKLKNGNYHRSCGCKRRFGKRAHYKGYCDVSGQHISDIRCRAKKKAIEFDIDAEFLWNLYIKQNKKCAISNLDIIINENASVDRVDSIKGYTKDNVQWVHKDINKMKSDLSNNKFLDYCKTITEFNKSI